jgi:hypothetical protein
MLAELLLLSQFVIPSDYDEIGTFWVPSSSCIYFIPDNDNLHLYRTGHYWTGPMSGPIPVSVNGERWRLRGDGIEPYTISECQVWWNCAEQPDFCITNGFMTRIQDEVVCGDSADAHTWFSQNTGISGAENELFAEPVFDVGLFIYSNTLIGGLPFGNGTRCVGGPSVVRTHPVQPNASNQLTVRLPHSVFLGNTTYVQAWYRDGASFNLSDCIQVVL